MKYNFSFVHNCVLFCVVSCVICSSKYFLLFQFYSKTWLQRPLKKNWKLVFKTNDRIMQVKCIAECSKGSILQNFWPSLSSHFSLRSLFSQFLSGRLRLVLLYTVSSHLFSEYFQFCTVFTSHLFKIVSVLYSSISQLIFKVISFSNFSSVRSVISSSLFQFCTVSSVSCSSEFLLVL